MENSSSRWIVCPDCENTSRALAVMLRRVLATRRHCPGCQSLSAPQIVPVHADVRMAEAGPVSNSDSVQAQGFRLALV